MTAGLAAAAVAADPEPVAGGASTTGTGLAFPAAATVIDRSVEDAVPAVPAVVPFPAAATAVDGSVEDAVPAVLAVVPFPAVDGSVEDAVPTVVPFPFSEAAVDDVDGLLTRENMQELY